MSPVLKGHKFGPRSPEVRAMIAASRRRIQPRPCAQCGQDFTPTRSVRKFCSRACHQASLWRGDEASRSTIHEWLSRRFPKARICEECGAEGQTDYAFTKHGQPYTRERADYRELCRRCHTKFDMEMEVR